MTQHRLSIIAAMLFFGFCSVARNARADGVVLYPLDAVNANPGLATAVEMAIGAELEARGHRVIAGNGTGQAVPRAEPVYQAAPAPGGVPPATVANASPSPVSAAAAGAAAGEGAPATAGGAASRTDASGATQAPLPPDEAKASAAQRLGASFYIDGSVARLGSQIGLDLRLHAADGTLVAEKKTNVRAEAGLPRAVQLSAITFVQEMRRRHAAPVEPPVASARRTRIEREDSVIRNFGVAVGQLISLTDSMYTFTFIDFNGRFEFNRLMLINNAGFAVGNREVADGFHFNVSLALAGYLLRTQVSPYLGGGIGMFIGNRLDPCADEADEWGTSDTDRCDETSVVGWDVFPVVGLEVLKTRPVRVHVEGRYLVSFNAYKTWGHGPMIIIGAAF